MINIYYIFVMSKKQFILQTFKKEYYKYLDFGEKNVNKLKSDLAYVRQISNMFFKFNSHKIMQLWFTYITIPYNEIILKGDYEFFLEKDYQDDIKDMGEENIKYFLHYLKIVKEESKTLDDKKKQEFFHYIQKLTKLSIMYFNN